MNNEMTEDIRFTDSKGKVLFWIPDGGSIRLTDKEGKSRYVKCYYVDDFRIGIQGKCMLIRKFAEEMEKQGITYVPKKERGESLPYMCFSVIPRMGRLIVVKRNEPGYYPLEPVGVDEAENRKWADIRNECIGVTKAQEAAMYWGSMFGWDVPGADPKKYDAQGKLKRPKKKEKERER